MAQLPQAANTDGNDSKLEGFTPIPAGDYTIAIVKSEMKETKKKDGFYLNLHMKVQEGEHKGKMLFENLNLVNPNPVAVEIANKKLNSICEACGLQGVEDSDELHGIPFGARVSIQAATESWPEQNKIQSFFNLDAAPAGNAKSLPWE